MSNSAPDSNPDDQKRRSSRIVQAVPLTVTGVDALGRPFQERTSTLIVNCHGCRYQSKHYVLKNMWVTLSVPHPEPDHEPRSVRGRVMWIRRPHTVRELFQVGIELETAGNLWGIAFPPPDWFPFPESASAAGSSVHVSEIPLPPAPAVSPEPQPEPAPLREEDNVRTIPFGTGDPSLLLARQMARLVNEARQQLQTAVRETAAEAVSSEARPLIVALQAQIQEVARQSIESVAEHAVQQTVEKTTRASETQLEQLREFWNRQLSESIQQAHQTWTTRVEETVQQLRGSFAQDLQNESQQAIRNLDRASRDFQEQLSRAQENISRLSHNAEGAAAPLVADIEQRLRAQADSIRAQLESMELASRKAHEDMRSAAAAEQASWQAQLGADLQGAHARWNDRIEMSLETAVQQGAERLAQRSQDTFQQMEHETGLRLAAMGRALLEAGADAEQRMAGLRAALDAQAAHAQGLLIQAEAAAREVEEQTEQLHAMEHTVLVEMERRGGALLDAQAQKLDQRAEAALNTWSAQFAPAVETAGRQVVARLGAELEQQFGAQLEKAGQVLGDLQNQTQAAVRSMDQHADSMRILSEQTVNAALERLEGSVGRLEQDLQESSRNAAAKWIAEIDAKATEVTHTTFESLFKTSEWYEKKVYTQMHSTLEKGVEQAKEELREKAGEISRLFASEMDHYSRSFVDHTQSQIDEAGRGALADVQKQASDISAGASRSIAQQTQNHTDSALGQFRTSAGALLSQISSQLEALTGQARAKFDAESEQSHAQFQSALGQNVQEALRNSRQDLAADLDAAKETLRAESGRQTTQLQQSLTSLNDEAIESYRRRLEAASESTLLTASAKFNQATEQQLDALAHSAEIRLRDACTQVFSTVGESLRRRLLDVALQPLAENPPAKPGDPPTAK